MITGLHIEPTNKCTLKCPRCSRTEFIGQFPNAWKNHDLDLDAFKNFLDIKGLDIKLCGDYGDPIYYPRLHELVSFVKEQGSSVSIHTNGSYQPAEWWDDLGKLLDSNDSVIFAIDGLPNNFTTYRINADWDSIRLGIDALRGHAVRMEWQYILFRYNEDCINQARELSDSLGFDHFFVVPSARFDRDDDELIPSTGRDNRSIEKIKWKDDRNSTIDPECKKEDNYHYISSLGQYTPCCWAGEHRFFYKSMFWKNKEIYNIKNTTLSRLLSDERTVNFYDNLERDKPEYCTFNCSKEDEHVI